MATAKQIKAAGLKSTAAVSLQTGVGRQTLDNWHKYKPVLFKVVLAGCVAINETKSNKE